MMGRAAQSWHKEGLHIFDMQKNIFLPYSNCSVSKEMCVLIPLSIKYYIWRITYQTVWDSLRYAYLMLWKIGNKPTLHYWLDNLDTMRLKHYLFYQHKQLVPPTCAIYTLRQQDWMQFNHGSLTSGSLTNKWATTMRRSHTCAFTPLSRGSIFYTWRHYVRKRKSVSGIQKPW